VFSKKKDEEDEDEDTHESKLEVHFLSFTTFYYLVSSFQSPLANFTALGALLLFREVKWRFGVVVARWSRSTWLSYIGPG